MELAGVEVECISVGALAAVEVVERSGGVKVDVVQLLVPRLRSWFWDPRTIVSSSA